MPENKEYDISQYIKMGSLTNQPFDRTKVKAAIKEIHHRSPLQRLLWLPEASKKQAAQLWATYKGLMDFYIQNVTPQAKEKSTKKALVKALVAKPDKNKEPGEEQQ